MAKKERHRKPINIKKRKRPTGPPPIDYSKIPESGCPAKVGIWPWRKICGHKYFIPLINVKIVPNTKPVMFGLSPFSPFAICEKCGANLRDELDAESAAFFRGEVGKAIQSEKTSNIKGL